MAKEAKLLHSYTKCPGSLMSMQNRPDLGILKSCLKDSCVANCMEFSLSTLAWAERLGMFVLEEKRQRGNMKSDYKYRILKGC